MADLEQRLLQVEVAEAIPGRASIYEPLPFVPGDVNREIKRTKRKHRLIGVLIALLVALVAFIVAALLVLKVPTSLYGMADASMSPTLERGQTVYVMTETDVGIGEVAMYSSLSGQTKFGRIIAGPGEWVGVTDDEQIAVSDTKLSMGAVIDRGDSTASIVSFVELPDDTYFVLGDAEKPDKETLATPDNFITPGQIIGKAVFKVWPLPNIGFVG